MRKLVLVTSLLSILFLVAACGGGEPTPDMTVVAKMAEEAVQATLTAQPTATSVPTNTSVPSTNTPQPTDTPVPPTSTPTPVPPTDTPVPPTDTPTPTPSGPPATSYSFDELGFSVDYPGTLPLFVGDSGVNSVADEDFILLVNIKDRDKKVEENQKGDNIASSYAEAGQEIIKVVDCEEFEVTSQGEWEGNSDINPSWVTQGKCKIVGSPIMLPLDWQSVSVVTEDKVYFVSMFYFAPDENYFPDTVKASFKTYEQIVPSAYAEITSKSANLRAGPGTGHPVVGASKQGATLEIMGKSKDGTWWEVCCVDGQSAWVAGSIIKTGGDISAVSVAENIPTPPPAPPTATPAPPPKLAGLHERQTVGTWEIQPERVHKEKVVYRYSSSYVAMGNYAIVIVLAKNLAPGTDYMANSIALGLRDDKGRIYEYSEPYSVERNANIAAAWQFVVHPTPFRSVDPGVETPLLMLWDVSEDVESLTLIVTDGKTRAEWDLGNFSNIPPYQKE